MRAEPRVSAVIAVRDGERFLAEAIESVLAQTRPCFELIVVDNGSRDRSREIAASYGPPVVVTSEPRPGIGPARNAGLAAARGDFLAFLDYDDCWDPRKNELQIAAFQRDPELDVVFGHVQQFADPSYDPALHGALRIPSEPQPGLFLPAQMARRDAWERVGPWRSDLKLSDGLEWLLRARSLGLREAMIPETVLRRRVHGANHTRLHTQDRVEFARFLKQAIDERRRRAAE
jgi:glycosyltransferase involved in cell wall biosynthesis